MSVDKQISLLMSDEGCGVFPINEIKTNCVLFDLGFDSLRFMELVVLIEEYFNITFPDELLEISPDTKVSDIIKAVDECIKTTR
ncbi:acyl carrier protein [Cytobacillus oceanisediminis]|uniref:acyl carrier protein n=1 Tax=Cytobacillus oceanisediminis TaxID=665099 RepID=UPI001C229421|nr:acyl carrier protein [Cytobacillus oceanisediminis]MBU8772118.1 acyl carrier protein [Cytobacillus oceanisediminis]